MPQRRCRVSGLRSNSASSALHESGLSCPDAGVLIFTQMVLVQSTRPSEPATADAAGGELPAAHSETEQLLTLLQELEDEVFAATASAEKEEVRYSHPSGRVPRPAGA